MHGVWFAARKLARRIHAQLFHFSRARERDAVAAFAVEVGKAESIAIFYVGAFVQRNSDKCHLNEKETRNGLRLIITFDKITSIDKALRIISGFVE